MGIRFGAFRNPQQAPTAAGARAVAAAEGLCAAAGPGDDAGQAAANHVRIIVWCKACQHQVEPDPTEMASRYSAEMSVLDCERLSCSTARKPEYRYGAHRDAAVIGAERRSARVAFLNRPPTAARRLVGDSVKSVPLKLG